MKKKEKNKKFEHNNLLTKQTRMFKTLLNKLKKESNKLDKNTNPLYRE